MDDYIDVNKYCYEWTDKDEAKQIVYKFMNNSALLNEFNFQMRKYKLK